MKDRCRTYCNPPDIISIKSIQYIDLSYNNLVCVKYTKQKIQSTWKFIIVHIPLVGGIYQYYTWDHALKFAFTIWTTFCLSSVLALIRWAVQVWLLMVDTW